MFYWKVQIPRLWSEVWKSGSKYLHDYHFMKSQNWPFKPPQRFLFRNTMLQNTPRPKRCESLFICQISPSSAILQVIFVQPGFGNVECWGSGRWWRQQCCSQSPRHHAGTENTCRIPLSSSSLGYLIFRCLVLIKGICHVQWPLLSTTPGFPYVISLFKPCLRLCQVLTVALSTRV